MQVPVSFNCLAFVTIQNLSHAESIKVPLGLAKHMKEIVSECNKELS